jgi:superfamily II RNA helicase
MKYKEFILDDFQEQAINALNKNHSVVVSAATGTGKTLIADYIIDKDIKEGKRVVYTAPIKALSNQKYQQFVKEYGEHRVGILTGDVVINPAAEVLVMTTEIYRNMLVTKDPSIERISYVIFDEIHYINDIERGVVWEESIIFSPRHVRFLCLSATIPNAEEFAAWIEKTQQHKVEVVRNEVRAVPLTHKFFDTDLGITTLEEIKELIKIDKSSEFSPRGKRKKRSFKIDPPYFADLIHEVVHQKKTPAIYFAFSRKKTEEFAKELSKKNDYASKEQKQQIIQIWNRVMRGQDPQIMKLASTRLLKQVVERGIGIHHAGLLPAHKHVVEELFGKGLLTILFATETFAVGLNFPAKTVCFDSLEKFDGINFRYLNSKEYFQIAGRAGRRGIDKEGLAISMIDRRFANIKKIKKLTTADTDPIISQFRLTTNSVLNMIHHYTEEEINTILQSSFITFQKNRTYEQQRRSFDRRKKTLQKMGYLKGNTLTQKGLFATHIYANELLITELFFETPAREADPLTIATLIGAIIYEPRKNDEWVDACPKKIRKEIGNIIHSNKYTSKKFPFENATLLYAFIKKWYDQCEFIDLLELTTFSEGDIIRFFRQMIDFIEQIKKATTDYELIDKLNVIKTRIDREFVAQVF